MALVVLKKYYVDEGMGEIAFKLNIEQKQKVFELLHELFSQEKSEAWNRKILDIMAMIANDLDRNAVLLEFLCKI